MTSSRDETWAVVGVLVVAVVWCLALLTALGVGIAAAIKFLF